VNIRVTAQRVTAVAAILAFGACKARDQNAVDTTAARTDTAANRVAANTDTGARKVDSAAGSIAKRGGWSSASILAFASAASNGEIREGELAERKATNPTVKSFARQVVADHRAMLSDGKALATKLKVTPDTADDDVRDVVKHSSDDIKDLTDKKAGLDWDKDYIDKQIKDHKDVLDKLQDAAKNTSDPQLRAEIEKATGKVQQHLTKAQDIKDNALSRDSTKAKRDTTKR
jgi:putative membrane protein